MSEHQKAWSYLQSEFPVVFGETACKGWLKFLRFQEDLGGKVILSVPSRFIKDWISSRYLPKILELWQKITPELHGIDIISDRADEKGAPAQNHVDSVPAGLSYVSDDLTSRLDPRLTFDNFIVGKSNELAYAATKRVAEAEQIYFNPLFLYGGVGLGKTHLMHAIAWHLHHHAVQRKVVYMSAEKFMYLFVKALRQKDMIAFREQLRSVDVLMIDDVQFISGKESTQEEFFHTFNALIDQKKQIILSADKAPSELKGIEERMRSRLGWGLSIDIHPTTYELRLGILQLKAKHLPVTIESNVLEFLAQRITSNIRELEGALNRLVAHATLINETVTLAIAEEALKDLIRSNQKTITVETIQKDVAQHFNIKVSDLCSAKRVRNFVRPRQIAMFFSKEMTSQSLPEIGKKFGGKDHTTVMHAVKSVVRLEKENPEFAADIALLRKLIYANA